MVKSWSLWDKQVDSYMMLDSETERNRGGFIGCKGAAPCTLQDNKFQDPCLKFWSLKWLNGVDFLFGL